MFDNKKEFNFKENLNNTNNNNIKSVVNSNFNKNLDDIKNKEPLNIENSNNKSNYFVEEKNNNNGLKEILNIKNTHSNERLKEIINNNKHEDYLSTPIEPEEVEEVQTTVFTKESNSMKDDAKELLKNQTSKLKNIDYKTKVFIITYLCLAIVWTLVTGLFGSWEVAKIVLTFFIIFGLLTGLFYILFIKFKSKNDKK